MSLVNQLEITLKDFWPDPSNGIIIIFPNRGTSVTVSKRLNRRLSDYAWENKVPLHSVIEQLRAEIQQS